VGADNGFVAPPRVAARHDEVASATSFAGYRHLAMRVIDQALRDLEGPCGTPGDRDSARAFLAGSPLLHLWCAVADVNPGTFGGGRRPGDNGAAGSGRFGRVSEAARAAARRLRLENQD
jgi:hypothetical protein